MHMKERSKETENNRNGIKILWRYRLLMVKQNDSGGGEQNLTEVDRLMEKEKKT